MHDTLPVVFHDLPGKPIIHITKHSSLASRETPIILRSDQYLPRTTSPTRQPGYNALTSSSSLAGPRDAVWVPPYSVGRLKTELVAAAVAHQQQYCNHARNDSDNNSELSSYTRSHYYFPSLGERFLILHINHRVPGDSEAVSTAARHVQCLIPGAPLSLRVYSVETDITIRCLWLGSHDGAAAAHVTSSSATLIEGISGTLSLSGVRMLLMETLTRNNFRRPLEESGWSLVMAVPGIARNSGMIESFVITDELERLWDVNALRGAMPLCEQSVPPAAEQHSSPNLITTSPHHTRSCASPKVVVTIYLQVYSQHGVVVTHSSAPTRLPVGVSTTAARAKSLSTRNETASSRDDKQQSVVVGRTKKVQIHSSCVPLDPTPHLVGCVSVHEDVPGGGAGDSQADDPPSLMEHGSPRITSQRHHNDGHHGDDDAVPTFLFGTIAPEATTPVLPSQTSAENLQPPEVPSLLSERRAPSIATSPVGGTYDTTKRRTTLPVRRSVYLVSDDDEEDSHASVRKSSSQPLRHHHHDDYATKIRQQTPSSVVVGSPHRAAAASSSHTPTLDALRTSITSMEARALRSPSMTTAATTGASSNAAVTNHTPAIVRHPTSSTSTPPHTSPPSSSGGFSAAVGSVHGFVLSSPMPVDPNMERQRRRHATLSRSPSASYVVGSKQRASQ
ncbi:Hypothetical protein, putative [Bodo saltans]|uniref:Uncharacterized protein n=1 Tax=Bodo saltans TaxID=75058 RepID=A0A0S4JNR6_BODSA|nr:Hypothetical protein, putative [Bodo saltans]|eukprot:CUG90923.1 Hypothetical protein, putative [Bodo saltans]